MGSRSMVCRFLSEVRVPDDFNKFNRLGLGRLGRKGQRRVPLVLFPRWVAKEEGDGD